jgi:ketosteroid isomerase-like protein
MRRSRYQALLTSFVISCALWACAAPQGGARAFTEEDAAAVRTNLVTYMAADPIDEPDRFFGQFTEDVYWVYSDEAPWDGMEALHNVEWCHTLLGEISADHVAGSGDLAYARGTYRLSLDCGDGAPEDSEGTFLSVHRRLPDGTWRIESLYQGVSSEE